MISQAEDDPNRWPITDEDRRLVIASLLTLIEGPDKPVAIRACRILIQMDLANLRFASLEEAFRERVLSVIQRRSRKESES
jgi:hypothetical protein